MRGNSLTINMTNIEASITIKANGKTFTQSIAGGLPQPGEHGWIFLDGSTHEEILKKLLINAMGVYATAICKNSWGLEFHQALASGQKTVLDFLDQNETLV